MAKDLLGAAKAGPEWLSRTDLAELVGRAPSTIDKWRAAERISYSRWEGRLCFFSRADVVRFLRDDYLAPKAGRSA